MSESMLSPLAQALMASAGAGAPQMPQTTHIGGQPPLASMMAPNAVQLQGANPSLPWYAVPGMFPGGTPMGPRPPMPPPGGMPGASPGVPGVAPSPAEQAMMPPEWYGSPGGGNN